MEYTELQGSPRYISCLFMYNNDSLEKNVHHIILYKQHPCLIFDIDYNKRESECAI